jgi:tRNA pseudouridine synthase 10
MVEVDISLEIISSIQEELIKEMHNDVLAENYLFHSGGREDIDVRMLGNGRPFILECVHPKKAVRY